MDRGVTMTNEERQFHLRMAENIEARANAIIEQVRRGEKNKTLLKTAHAQLADAARIRGWAK
ncbi:hypothetical protein D9M70_411110 [compost metagenome]